MPVKARLAVPYELPFREASVEALISLGDGVPSGVDVGGETQGGGKGGVLGSPEGPLAPITSES